MSSISTNVFPPKKKCCHQIASSSEAVVELPLPRSRRERLLGAVAGIPKFQAFLLLIFYGSSSQVSRGVAACLQQGKEALLQIESASMPLDVHKNCLRICIARCRRVERLLEMSFFDSAAGVEAKRRRKSRPILSVSLQPKTHPFRQKAS